MKKRYEKPTVEVVKFQYRDQVVVASNSPITCTGDSVWRGYNTSAIGTCHKDTSSWTNEIHGF